MEPKIKVFSLNNPEWSQSMILESIEAVLQNIRTEIEEYQSEIEVLGIDKASPVDLRFEIGLEERTREELDALDEWDG